MRAPRLGPLLRLKTILTARPRSLLDESWGQRQLMELKQELY
jgi:hypothetical protein